MESGLDSSNEELTSQEKLLLSYTRRQEPQGEEHDTSVRKLAEMSNTTDPHKDPCSSVSSSTCSSISGDNGPTGNESSRYYSPSKSSNMSGDSNSHSAYNTLIIHQNNSSLLADTWIPASHEFTSVNVDRHYSQNPQASTSKENRNYPASLHSQNDDMSTSNALADIPRDCLDQLTVLRHLAKEVQDSAGPSGTSLLRSASFSKSQPDLSQAICYPHFSDHADTVEKVKKKKHVHTGSGPNSCKSSSSGTATPPLHHCSNGPSVQILEILMRENASLKAELLAARRKMLAIQKLESELSSLQASHAALFESTERRESLERTARTKLSSEVKRLAAVNRELLSSSNSLQNLSPFVLGSDVEQLKKELVKKDLAITQLVSQNKELHATKERQDIELAAQRATLTEQRNHIDILDAALTNAQANVFRLEEESRKKQDYVAKVSQLQRALSSLQLSNEKREQSEKKLRNQLEAEVSDLKLQLASTNATSNVQQAIKTGFSTASAAPANSTRNGASPTPQPPPYPGVTQGNTTAASIQARTQQEIHSLQEKLKLSEEKIMLLNTQVAKWEQLFASRAEKQNFLNSGPSCPQTPSAWHSRGGTPTFFVTSNVSGGPEEMLACNASQEYEWKMKDLESQLQEKDAVIRMLFMQNLPGSSNFLPRSPASQLPMPPPHSSYSPSHAPLYRESPCYSNLSIKPHGANGVSLSSLNTGPVELDPVYMYSKVEKCESEPPSYANLPIKMRLGGSGSSLVKNSNESLQSGSGTSNGVNISSNSGQASPSLASSKSGSQVGATSIDEQLKELDNQLLSKDGPGSLKLQSSFCCIPGFTNPSFAARKGKVSQPLLESLSRISANNANCDREPSSTTHGSTPPKNPLLPPLPVSNNHKVTSDSYYHSTPHELSDRKASSSNSQARTSSGPPFISPVMNMSSGNIKSEQEHLRTLNTLSNSMDSIAQERNLEGSRINVFSPVSLPTGLPPRFPAEVPGSALTPSKCRSLERTAPSSGDYGREGRYTSIGYDAARCKSLDRREVKSQQHSQNKAEEKAERKTKSSVSSKAAFFGQLLTRRSPSPSRNKDKEKHQSEQHTSTSKSSKFSFSPPPSKSFDVEQDAEAAFLDKQGRSSQRNRGAKWSMSAPLEAVQEQESTNSWVQRQSAEYSLSDSNENCDQKVGFRNGIPNVAPPDSKKWGKIVKTPFGLRYTFGNAKNTDGQGSARKSSDDQKSNLF